MKGNGDHVYNGWHGLRDEREEGGPWVKWLVWVERKNGKGRGTICKRAGLVRGMKGGGGPCVKWLVWVER